MFSTKLVLYSLITCWTARLLVLEFVWNGRSTLLDVLKAYSSGEYTVRLDQVHRPRVWLYLQPFTREKRVQIYVQCVSLLGSTVPKPAAYGGHLIARAKLNVGMGWETSHDLKWVMQKGCPTINWMGFWKNCALNWNDYSGCDCFLNEIKSPLEGRLHVCCQ